MESKSVKDFFYNLDNEFKQKVSVRGKVMIFTSCKGF